MTSMYYEGVKTAVAHFPQVRAAILRLLKGPAGEPLVRLPIASLLGAGTGYTIGKYLGSAHPERQAVTGAMVPVVGTVGSLTAMPLRRALLKALTKTGASPFSSLRKSPFDEVHRRLGEVFKVEMPKNDIGEELGRMFKNPLQGLRLNRG